MSLAATRWALPLVGIGLVPKMLLLLLADHADDAGRCWPSMARLAQLGCMSERAARNGVRKLEEIGLIVAEARSGVATVYTLKTDFGQSKSPENDPETPARGAPPPRQEMPGSDANPGTWCPPPRHVVPETPARGAPEPTNEPTIEPRKEESVAFSVSAEASRSAPPTEPRGTRLPDGWQPSPPDVAFASGLGLDVERVADEFRDYWRGVAGAKGRKADWSATWRNGCRRSAERRPQQSRAGPGQRRPAQNGVVELLLQAREHRSTPDRSETEYPLLEGTCHAAD